MEQWPSGYGTGLPWGPRFKTIRQLKKLDQSNEQQWFLETLWLKVSPCSDSAAFKELNFIHKVVHWDKWTLKRDHDFFANYTWSILLKYNWSMLKVYLKYNSWKYTWSVLKVYFKVTLKCWFNFTKCVSYVLLLSK